MSTNRLTAWGLVRIMSVLTGMGVEVMAKAGAVPTQNLRTWLSGKQQNLRMQSINIIMGLLGLRVDSNGVALDNERVHFWQIHEGLFDNKKALYKGIGSISPLLVNCAITRIHVPNDRAEYHMIRGNGVRVVLICHRSLFHRRPIVTPDLVKGAYWADSDTESHTINIKDARLGVFLQRQDLTIHEFDRLFNQQEDKCSWNDVALIAREYGVQAHDVCTWINSRAAYQAETSKGATPRVDAPRLVVVHDWGGKMAVGD